MRPKFQAIPTSTRTLLTSTIIISSLRLLAARSKHKIRVNLKIGTRKTRIGVPRELEGWMKTTLYRDNTTLRWILFEDRVAPRHHRQLPDGVDRCVCMLQPARTTIDGVSYMASCRTAMSRGQCVFESHARQIEQDDLFISGVLTAQSCENLLHYDVEPNTHIDACKAGRGKRS